MNSFELIPTERKFDTYIGQRFIETKQRFSAFL